MRLRILFWFVLLALGLLSAVSASAQAEDRVVVAPIRGIINPPLAQFVERAIQHAEDTGAAAVVFQMDTPGGLDDSMRVINQRILGANVPVVVYVSPSGARAGSAGVYIAYAAHVSAMAPGTNIGSATPVAMGEGGEQQMSDEMRAKIINDAVAYIRGLAEERGRNADWAEEAVREGSNIGAREAAETEIVDLVAGDLRTLLREIDGMQVQTPAGEVQLNTADAGVEQLEMSPFEQFLHLISNPTIAFILLSLGSIGLFLELSNPGSIFPGAVGVISLLLAFYALGTLPVNFVGLALLVLGIGLMIADVFTPSAGLLTAGGAVTFVLGALMLFEAPEGAPFLRVSLVAIAGVTIILVAFFLFVVGSVALSWRRKVVTGREGLVGLRGEARTELNPKGMVWVDSELWSATSEGGPVKAGQEVEVVRVEKVHLLVQPVVAATTPDGSAVTGSRRRRRSSQQTPQPSA